MIMALNRILLLAVPINRLYTPSFGSYYEYDDALGWVLSTGRTNMSEMNMSVGRAKQQYFNEHTVASGAADDFAHLQQHADSSSRLATCDFLLVC